MLIFRPLRNDDEISRHILADLHAELGGKGCCDFPPQITINMEQKKLKM